MTEKGHEDPSDEGQNVLTLALAMTTSLGDARVCLERFDANADASSLIETEAWDEYLATTAVVSALSREQMPVLVGSNARSVAEGALFWEEVRRRAGLRPSMAANRERVLDARAFVLALARLGRSLAKLADRLEGNAKAGVESAVESLDDGLPGVRLLRNSIEHSEDRQLGLGPHDKPIKLLKREEDIPAGDLMIFGRLNADDSYVHETLNGRLYSATAVNGSDASVEISAETLRTAENALRAALAHL